MESLMKNIFFIFFMVIFSMPSSAEDWTITSSNDEMTGEKKVFAISTYDADSTVKMDSPYTDVKASIGIGCTQKSEWIYIVFTESPNLSNTTTKDGYDLIETRIKLDNDIKNVLLIQKWTGKSLQFLDAKKIINPLLKSKTLLVELDWISNGKTFFKFPLNGLDDAVKKIRAECNIAQSEQQIKTEESSQNKNELDEANDRINTVWNGTTKAIRKALLPEQRAWLKQREKDCSGQDNKIHCMAEMTDQRTEELKQKIASM